MKKNLAVRIGAIVMVLMVAFFSILPDLVNAEGDDADLLAESEIVADAEEPDISEIPDVPENPDNEGAEDLPAEEAPGEDLGDGDVSGGEAQEPEVTEPEVTEPEVPAEPETPDEGEDSSESGSPDDGADSEDKPAEPETPGEEDPSLETPDGSEDETDPEGTNPAETNPAESEDAGEMDTIDDYLAMVDWSKFEKTTGAAKQFEDPAMKGDAELFVSEEEDFLIDGTTLVKYLGSAPYVEIPGNITVIGEGAFAGNTSLLGVMLPAGLQAIGSSAFNGCSNLAEISIPDSVTSVGDSAFANCTGLAAAAIGNGTGSIASNEFYNCISLQSVAVPEGISSVSAGAFANCSNLSSVSLPSTLTSLDRSAFSGDTNLASVSAAGGAYSSYDGCIYTGDGRQLLLCPQGKTGISIAPETASIASGAFAGCNYLLSATVPEAASAIETNAFSGSAIKSVTIPTGVTSIGSQSGWAPNVVYGYTGSTAETWAKQNNYVFESLNGSPAEATGSVADEHIEDPDDGEEGTVDNEKSGSGRPRVTASSSGTGSGTTAAISRNAGSRTNATPKTGVEDYGIYFLFASIFLIGIAFFAYSRKLRLDR